MHEAVHSSDAQRLAAVVPGILRSLTLRPGPDHGTAVHDVGMVLLIPPLLG
jgi:hypothetical protein